MTDLEITTKANSTLVIGGVQYSAKSFWVNQTLVLRINICDKNPPLSKAGKPIADIL